jgi:hypothetical protein
VVILAAWGFRAAWRANFLEACAIVSIFLALLVIHSPYESWNGGWSWGPRYLLPAFPGLCALTSLLRGKGRSAVIVLSIASFLIGAPTLFSFYERHFDELLERGIDPGPGIAWSFSKAPFLNLWPASMREVRDASRNDVRDLFAKRGSPGRDIADSRALRIVATWWWVLPIAGISRWVGFSLSVLLAFLGLFILIRSMPKDLPAALD